MSQGRSPTVVLPPVPPLPPEPVELVAPAAPVLLVAPPTPVPPPTPVVELVVPVTVVEVTDVSVDVALPVVDVVVLPVVPLPEVEVEVEVDVALPVVEPVVLLAAVCVLFCAPDDASFELLADSSPHADNRTETAMPSVGRRATIIFTVDLHSRRSNSRRVGPSVQTYHRSALPSADYMSRQSVHRRVFGHTILFATGG